MAGGRQAGGQAQRASSSASAKLGVALHGTAWAQHGTARHSKRTARHSKPTAWE